jgi:hypothetical protein
MNDLAKWFKLVIHLMEYACWSKKKLLEEGIFGKVDNAVQNIALTTTNLSTKGVNNGIRRLQGLR